MQSGTESSALFQWIMQNNNNNAVQDCCRSSSLPEREVPHNVWLPSFPKGRQEKQGLSFYPVTPQKINQGFQQLYMVLLIFLEFSPYTKDIFLLIPLAGLSTAFHFPCRKFRLSHSCLCPFSRKTPFYPRAILCRMEYSNFAFSGLKMTL